MILPLACLCLVPSLLHAMPARSSQALAAGKSRLGIWQLKANTQAMAHPYVGMSATHLPPTPRVAMAYALDAKSELQLDITRCDGSPESVTLSNAIEIAPQAAYSHTWLRFRVRTAQAHTIPLTLESAGKVFWSAPVQATPEWQECCLPLALEACKTDQAILTLQLGTKTGVVSVADVRIESSPTEIQ